MSPADHGFVRIDQKNELTLTLTLHPQVGLGPAHLTLLAGMLTSPGPGIHTCILSANQLGGLSKHAGAPSLEETGGIAALARALRVNATLTILDLTNNCVTPTLTPFLSPNPLTHVCSLQPLTCAPPCVLES